MPVDSHLDILNGVTAVEGPHGVSLGGGKQHCAGAQRPLKGLQAPYRGWQMTLVASLSSYNVSQLDRRKMGSTNAARQSWYITPMDDSFWHMNRLTS